MKNYFVNLLILFSFICFSQQQGPIISQKLETPEKIIKQYIQKRTQTWIEGQWKVENNNYIWMSGHWVQKRIGYHFINGKWMQKENGWAWLNGYWEAVSIKKWKILYS
tara:strand:+ start:730 stop:1053 length:324 start_codon:yes stop_codon:yes gene_type:complete